MTTNAVLDVLKASTFGKRTAEEERDHLAQYFVQTEQWNQVYSGNTDIVYGAKGSGKSAIYSLIIANENALFDRSIMVVPAENPQGAPAFQNISTDPPASEFEFVSLWKLYFLSICGQHFKAFGIRSDKCDRVVEALESADLVPSNFSLSKALRFAFDYIKRFTRISAVEGGYNFDPNTGMPTGITGRIVLAEPDAKQSKLGAVSVGELFALANEALLEKGLTFWVLLDRLDVAFADKADLEVEALRALFKCYLDLKAFRNIQLKIFLRTDIWNKITEQGFREASHIEKSITIKWKPDDLLNLVVRRIISNSKICEHYSVEPERVLESFERQEGFFYEVCPKQVESGPNKPITFKWILGRLRDANETAAPREIIHFLNELRETQITRLEKGRQGPAEPNLFEQISFKDALPAVSKVRLEQTLFAEFPSLKTYIEALREQKATQHLRNLAELWRIDEAECLRVASSLEEIGFFERVGSSKDEWSVPFLYRPALGLVQGSAA
ncbi:P-loop ATPase, Sll1717 family [Alsobacter soli]|uniref:P-loop ATPase, Sll1717 family n=1 Tax=Alsobacter soli TaxID=2109933 RepID=UPI0011B1E3EF|nr:hypothetical protein [Alsobacter soli]